MTAQKDNEFFDLYTQMITVGSYSFMPYYIVALYQNTDDGSLMVFTTCQTVTLDPVHAKEFMKLIGGPNKKDA